MSVGGLVPRPYWIPKSLDAQVSYIKWLSIVGPLLSMNEESPNTERPKVKAVTSKGNLHMKAQPNIC